MMGSAIVILAYLAVLAVILFPPSRLRTEKSEKTPWWRDVRFWAAVVVFVQIGVYATWG